VGVARERGFAPALESRVAPRTFDHLVYRFTYQVNAVAPLYRRQRLECLGLLFRKADA
jgi:hypothetical protein